MSLSVQERLRALADGKMIRRDVWDCSGRTDGFSYFYGDGDGVSLTAKNKLEIFNQDEPWHLYKEPELEITEEDVGRVAVTRRGSHYLITGFQPGDERPIRTSLGCHYNNGKRHNKGEDSLNDILKVIRNKS